MDTRECVLTETCFKCMYLITFQRVCFLAVALVLVCVPSPSMVTKTRNTKPKPKPNSNTKTNTNTKPKRPISSSVVDRFNCHGKKKTFPFVRTKLDHSYIMRILRTINLDIKRNTNSAMFL